MPIHNQQEGDNETFKTTIKYPHVRALAEHYTKLSAVQSRTSLKNSSRTSSSSSKSRSDLQKKSLDISSRRKVTPSSSKAEIINNTFNETGPEELPSSLDSNKVPNHTQSISGDIVKDINLETTDSQLDTQVNSPSSSTIIKPLASDEAINNKNDVISNKIVKKNDLTKKISSSKHPVVPSLNQRIKGSTSSEQTNKQIKGKSFKVTNRTNLKKKMSKSDSQVNTSIRLATQANKVSDNNSTKKTNRRSLNITAENTSFDKTLSSKTQINAGVFPEDNTVKAKNKTHSQIGKKEPSSNKKISNIKTHVNDKVQRKSQANIATKVNQTKCNQIQNDTIPKENNVNNKTSTSELKVELTASLREHNSSDKNITESKQNNFQNMEIDKHPNCKTLIFNTPDKIDTDISSKEDTFKGTEIKFQRDKTVVVRDITAKPNGFVSSSPKAAQSIYSSNANIVSDSETDNRKTAEKPFGASTSTKPNNCTPRQGSSHKTISGLEMVKNNVNKSQREGRSNIINTRLSSPTILEASAMTEQACRSIESQLSEISLDNDKNTSNQLSTKLTNSVTQLLHQDWRKVPWKSYFGWTDAHQRLYQRLKSEMNQREIVSIYYSNEDEYDVARNNWINVKHDETPFLKGPYVTSVCDMLAIIHKLYGTRSYGSLQRRPSRNKKRHVPEAPCYDAESEGC